VSALESLGQPVTLRGLDGQFPLPDETARRSLQAALAELPVGSVAILDGLAMGGLPDTLAEHSRRLRMIALVHHALADETGLDETTRDYLFKAERDALTQVDGIVTTSYPTAASLDRYAVPTEIIRVIEPGVTRPGFLQPPAARAGKPVRLLCVATLSARKAQHQLIEALCQLTYLDWQCTFAGSDQRQPEYAARLKQDIEAAGLTSRVTLTGELDEQALDLAWRNADLLVLPSLYEGYGMVVDEALSYGLPVLTTDGGALADTARKPGVRQYPAGDFPELRARLEQLLSDSDARTRLQTEAHKTAQALKSWSEAGEQFQYVIKDLLADAPDPSRFDGGWLSLRERADHAARSDRLTYAASHWLKEGLENSPLVLDIGCGTGSGFRYLAPRFGGNARWLLVDQDEELLAVAQRVVNETAPGMTVEFRLCRLTACDFPRQLPLRPHLVTASALIDLVTLAWLRTLADYVADARAGLLVTLSYAGAFSFNEPEPDDDWMQALINAHQQSHKGEGPALGPTAPNRLEQEMRARNYSVTLAESPWHLGPPEAELQASLVAGWGDAALAQAPLEQDRINRWLAARQEAIASGRLEITVAHLDLLALPETADS
jgi:glycosyltransferase involved in cell wall biosynthesis